jgi:hypothetical protein
MRDARHTPIYIRAASALGPQGDYQAAQRRALTTDPAPLEMKDLTRAIVGQPLRQASHFVELAVVGAQICLQRLTQPTDTVTPVYLGTGLAEVNKTTALFEQVLPPGEGLASPFDFINAANNMAAFYVARRAQFSARNLTVTEEEFSFEWALKLALGDLRHAGFDQALVGGVDENSRPRADHLRRISLRADQVMGEGSGWLYLTKDPTDALGEVLCVEQLAMSPGMSCGDWAQAVAACVAQYSTAQDPLYLLPGFRLTLDDISALLSKMPRATLTDYLSYCGCYHTAAAFGIGMLFDEPAAAAGRYFHVNRDATGRTLVIGVRQRDFQGKNCL